MNIRRIVRCVLPATAALLLFAACDMLVSHPYDVHVTGEKNLTEKNIALITESMRGRTSIRFAVISDTQKCYDETADAVEAINARADIDFLLHGGDLTDYGATKEFLWQRDILNGLAMPYVAVIGNHDCLATGVEAYRAVFGELNFAFTAGNTRFLCLNTNALEFDSPEPVPDFGFIRREVANARGAGIEKTVVLMHACPGSEQFNNNVAEEFQALIREMPGLQMCVYGHGHNVSADEFFGDGVMYYQCATVAKRSYLVFTLNADESYEYQVVEF